MHGKVFIDGKDIYKFNDDELAIFRRRQVGLIYQFYNLIPILNVEENMEILKVENLSKVYGKGESKVVALDNVSFSVEKGEFLAIVGTSGSRKINIIAFNRWC